MTTINEWYQRVEGCWPAKVPALTGAEAVRAAKRLYRFAMRKACGLPVEVTSGNRYSYIHGGAIYVNPARGWKALVHELSHSFHYRTSDDKPHSRPHARLELRMIKEVLKRGWLSGVLQESPRPVLSKSEQAQHQVTRIDALLDKWDTKRRRADNAIKKLNRQRKYYERKANS